MPVYIDFEHFFQYIHSFFHESFSGSFNNYINDSLIIVIIIIIIIMVLRVFVCRSQSFSGIFCKGCISSALMFTPFNFPRIVMAPRL